MHQGRRSMLSLLITIGRVALLLGTESIALRVLHSIRIVLVSLLLAVLLLLLSILLLTILLLRVLLLLLHRLLLIRLRR